jgi:hypothetical protein
MVYDGEDCVVPVTWWELGDQVHRNYFEWDGCYWYWDSIFRCGFLREVFVLLADRTPFDVLSNPGIHAYPVVVSFDKCDCVVSPGMSRHWIVMVLA